MVAAISTGFKVGPRGRNAASGFLVNYFQYTRRAKTRLIFKLHVKKWRSKKMTIDYSCFSTEATERS